MAQEPLSGYISMEISTEGKDGQQLSRSRFGWLGEKLVPKLFGVQFAISFSPADFLIHKWGPKPGKLIN